MNATKRRRFKGAAVLVLASWAATACNDRPTTAPATQAGPSAVLLDGTTGGNPHFYFLAPLGTTATYPGVFNGRLAPTVEVCRTTVLDASGHCVSLLASFNTNGGINNNGSKVDISLTGQHYSVSFNTKLYTIAQDVPFRITVLLGDLQIGFADVVLSGTKWVNATTGTTINLQNGRNLPIKFRIENGVMCGTTVNCFEGIVGPEGGTFTVTSTDGTKPAGTSFPAGALQDTVNLIIEEIASGECLPTDLQQFRNCYRFKTEPYVPNFALPVTVGVCMSEAAGLPYFDDKQLRLWKWSENPGDALQELERVQIEYLVCPTVTASASIGSPVLQRAARVGAWLGRPLAWLVGPRPAYAMIGYEGGKLGNFSRIGWVRPIQVSKVQGDNQSGFVSTTLPINPTVRVTNRYGALSQPIVGWRVDFTPSADGLATPPFSLTDANGEAFTAWTLGSTAGPNTLRAFVPTSRVIAPAPYEVETTFNASVMAWPTIGWLPPLQNSPGSGTLMLGISPQVVISEVGGAQLTTLNAVFATTHYAASWNVPTLDPAKIYRLAIRLYGTTLGYVDLQAIGNELRNVTTGDKVLNLDNSRNLPIKFTVLQ